MSDFTLLYYYYTRSLLFEFNLTCFEIILFVISIFINLPTFIAVLLYIGAECALIYKIDMAIHHIRPRITINFAIRVYAKFIKLDVISFLSQQKTSHIARLLLVQKSQELWKRESKWELTISFTTKMPKTKKYLTRKSLKTIIWLWLCFDIGMLYISFS